VIYLDTHILVWIYQDVNKLPKKSLELIENNDLHYSPLVKLELQYLYEINRISNPPEQILQYLYSNIGLKESDKAFGEIIEYAMGINWTRDAFDRLIVASAMASSAKLMTKDKNILKNFSQAVWT